MLYYTYVICSKFGPLAFLLRRLQFVKLKLMYVFRFQVQVRFNNYLLTDHSVRSFDRKQMAVLQTVEECCWKLHLFLQLKFIKVMELDTEEDEDDVFEVEKIVDTAISDVIYQLQWISCVLGWSGPYKPRTGTLPPPATHHPRNVRSASAYWLSTNFCSLESLFSLCKMCYSNGSQKAALLGLLHGLLYTLSALWTVAAWVRCWCVMTGRRAFSRLWENAPSQP